jgi:hypothetical protein
MKVGYTTSVHNDDIWTRMNDTCLWLVTKTQSWTERERERSVLFNNPTNWSGIDLLTFYEAYLELIKPPLQRLIIQQQVKHATIIWRLYFALFVTVFKTWFIFNRHTRTNSLCTVSGKFKGTQDFEYWDVTPFTLDISGSVSHTTSLDETRPSTIFYRLLLNWASLRRH